MDLGWRLVVSIALGLSGPTLTWAQSPDRDWRTLETPSYRVHYPVEYEAWTLRTARKLESVRARVAEEVAYAPAQRVDVVVMDPVAQANGFVLPLLGSPRMVLWTSPPSSDSIIGQFRSWPELLVVHEDAHLVHLLRPSRNPLSRFLERTILPIGPIARRSPRWVTEGYATVLEGQLTGSGRPHGDLRAAILRRWAQRGRLPSYDRLAFDTERWQGMSMAYLAGSAYLEWLVDRGGPGGLRDLWARLSARTVRSFDDAFSGVFGEEPEDLYGRFTAELVERAMAVERALAPHAREGELWQRLEWSTGVPAVSSDGDRLAIVIRHRERPARLVVWSTAPDVEGERKRHERISRMLERDPEDVAPLRDRPLPREPLHELPAVDGAGPESPRWMPDGTSILFVRFEADAAGFLHPDLFRWHLEGGRVERITRLTGIRQPDPHPDGRWAAAVRHRHGFSQLVRVDLASGVTGALTEPSVDIVYDAPRISPDGRQLVYLRHAGEDWRAVVRDLESGQERELETPPAAMVAHPAWSRDGATVFLAIGEHGFIDIQGFSVNGATAPYAVTRTQGAALGPEPTGEGSLYFLSLEPHGLDVRLIPIEPAPSLPPEVTHERLVPAVAPASPDRPQPAQADVESGHPYGLGRQEFMPLVGGRHSPSGHLLELGMRGGDLLGRLNYFAIGSLARGDGVAEGAALAAAWRGWAVMPRGHIFTVDERPSAQPTDVPGLGVALDARRRGLELAVDWQRQQGRRRMVHASAGGLLAQLEAFGVESLSQRTLFGELAYAANPSRGLWHWRYGGDLRLEGGRTGDGTWQRVRADAEVGLGYHRTALRLALERRHVGGAPSPFDRIQVGGIPGSIAPSSLTAARVHVPALPVGTLIGDRYERQRLDARLLVPIPFFYERHRVWNRGGQPGEWLRIVGSETHVATGPIPLVRLPAPVFRIGAARILDPPFEGENRWWISLTWRP
jgi:dipeptidyl aminopeptidase/acylaminoacyl peptidase